MEGTDPLTALSLTRLPAISSSSPSLQPKPTSCFRRALRRACSAPAVPIKLSTKHSSGSFSWRH